MSKSKQLTKAMITAAAFSTLVGTSAFADSRHQDQTWRDNNDRGRVELAASHENQRITTEGRITNLTRERDGYRVQLDRGGYSYWVPERSVRDRMNDFRVGVSISLGGVFRGGYVNVDAVTWPGNYRNDGYRDNVRGTVLRGTIERVDYRRDIATVREDRSGRVITVDLARADRGRRSRLDTNDLRRGDVVSFAGDWTRGGVFQANRIDGVNSRRY